MPPEGFRDGLRGDGVGERGGHLQRAQGAAGVAVGDAGQQVQRSLLGLHAGQPAFVCQCAVKQLQQLFRRQCLQDQRAGAAAKGRIDLEAGVLGSRADERQEAGFDMRQQSVLLGLVEAVNLVEKQDGARAPAPQAFSLRHGLADVFHAR